MSLHGRDQGVPADRAAAGRQRTLALAGAAVAALVLSGVATSFALTSAEGSPQDPSAPPAAPSPFEPGPPLPLAEEDRLPEVEHPPGEEPLPVPPPGSEMTPVPVVPVDMESVEIPDACAGLYSASMFEYLAVDEGLPLNDGTTLDPPFSKIAPVAALQEGLPGLVCTWGTAGHFGLLTQVNEVSASQAQAAVQTLRDVGFSCEERDGGTRCATRDSEGGEAWGETHVIRGNVWLCTFWANFTPYGYTSDIVDTLWE